MSRDGAATWDSLYSTSMPIPLPAVALLCMASGTVRADELERLVRAYERSDLERVHKLCQGLDGNSLRESDLRSMCAEAELDRSVPEHDIAALVDFSRRWDGTRASTRAFGRAARLASPGLDASEELLQKHARAFPGTLDGAWSLCRAEQLSFDAARSDETLSGWERHLEKYPLGELRDRAEQEALEDGLQECEKSGDLDSWRRLLALLPGSTATILLQGERWMAAQLAQALEGPAWTEATTSVPAGTVFRISASRLPWSPAVAVNWIALDPSGHRVEEPVIASALGLPLDRAVSILGFSEDKRGWSWTAPVDWAQPPSDSGLLWALAIEVGEAAHDPIPLVVREHWLAPPSEEVVLYEWRSSGLWVHGASESFEWLHLEDDWYEPPLRTGYSSYRMATAGHYLYLASQQGLVGVSLSERRAHRLEPGGEIQWIERAGDAVLVHLEEGSALCRGKDCDPPTHSPVDVHDRTGALLDFKQEEGEDRWILTGPEGSRFTSFPGWKPAEDWAPPAGSFDGTGERVLVVDGTVIGDSHQVLATLGVYETAEGTKTGAAEVLLENRGAESWDSLATAVRPVRGRHAWCLDIDVAAVRWNLDPVTIDLDQDGRPHLSQVERCSREEAWRYRRNPIPSGLDGRAMTEPGSPVPREATPTGWTFEGWRQGRNYKISLGQKSSGRVIVYGQTLDKACDGMSLDLEMTWLVAGEWVHSLPRYRLEGCAGFIGAWGFGWHSGQAHLIRVSDGLVIEASELGSLSGSFPPVGTGWVTTRHALLPSGRLVTLGEQASAVWGPPPLSMLLAIER